MATLIGFHFPEVEAKVKELYASRSAFVHGSFFKQMAKRSKASDSDLPIPNFNLLDQHRKYVRWSLVAYLNLARIIKTERTFEGFNSVMSLLERAIIDIDLRKKLTSETRKLFRLMPKEEPR